MERRDNKKRAKGRLKHHYLLFVCVCLISAFLGAEYAGSLSVLNSAIADSQVPSGVVAQASPEDSAFFRAVSNIILGMEDGGEELSKALLEEVPHSDNPVLGRSRGVLAQVVNLVSSGSIFVTLGSAVRSLVGSQNVAMGIAIVLSAILYICFYLLVVNLFLVVSRRIFLEGRIYEKVPVNRFTFLLRLRRVTKSAATILLCHVFQFLWSLTLVGGIIKHYSYFLVPYIVAENPDIGCREAITLSRRMMKGHKWECFVYGATFWGWSILGFLTLGLSAVLFSNPYQAAAYAEYYACRRAEFGLERLNDAYLFEQPSPAVLQKSYGDVPAPLLEKELPGLTGFRRVLANLFGILLFPSQNERDYEQAQAREAGYAALRVAAQGRCYPGRLSPLPEKEKRIQEESVHYMRLYTVWSLILMFFVFSFVGWVWEVSLHLIADGSFVNRGVLHGPWLPIYGSGGLLILVLLNKFRKHPAIEFLCAVVLCGFVEYGTAWYLELTHDGKKWWDYSGYFLNLDGRICAEGLLVFGLGGMLVVYILAPRLDDLFRKLPMKLCIPICLVFLMAFCGDQIYSSSHPNMGDGITEDYSSQVAQMSLEEESWGRVAL